MNLKAIIMKTCVTAMRIAYVPFKLQKTRNRITIISRQSNKPSLDIALLSNYIKENYPDVDLMVLCRKLEGESKIGYAFHMLTQMKAFATSRVVVLDGYCIAASILNHKDETTLIQIWHALAAIKKFGYQTLDLPGGRSRLVAETMCMHRNYDYVTCSGEATAEHFSQAFNTDMSKFRFYPLPRVDRILEEDKALEEAMSQKYGLDEFRKQGKEIILYVPTFRRGDVVKVGELAKALDPDKYALVVKLHPLDDNIEPIPETGLTVIERSRESSFDWMKVCDRIVTDYSALGVEATLTGKPLYFFVYDYNEYAKDVGININPLEELPEASAISGEEMKARLEEEYNYAALEKFRDKYIPGDTSNCTKRLGDFIYGNLKEASQKLS